MAMHAVSPFAQEAEQEEMNEINMIPFIDVMLVLLIVFIITVPVIHHSVNVQLPQASNVPEQVQPQTLRLSVRADGSYWLGQELLAQEQLQQRLKQAGAQEEPAQLHIRADRRVPYEHVAWAMAAAQRAGINKIGFITNPDRKDSTQ
ncbi:MAG: biopolymer transporter ExbD [Ottowia sp.]|nr:biopolymer transporter ExbD [Ottowia sp.]